jgi:hypothetical membrane protein
LIWVLIFGVGVREEEARDHLLISFWVFFVFLFFLFPFFCVLSIRKEGRKAGGGEIRERTWELKLHIPKGMLELSSGEFKRKTERWR